MKRLRGCLAGLLVVIVLLAGAGGAAWWYLRAAPSWYAPPDRNDPAVVALAETVEKRVAEEVQRIRPSGTAEDTWTLRVRDEQLSAWLAARLPEWLEREASFDWPELLAAPQAHFAPEGIDLAVRITEGALAERVVVARVRPELGDDGLTLHLERIGLGRASLGRAPIEALSGLLQSIPTDVLDERARTELTAMLSGGQAFEPVLALADGRRVRMLQFDFRAGAVDVTSRTEAK